MGLEMSNTAYVGNDINDMECLNAVGFPIIVKDSHSDLLGIAAYVTNRTGGDSAVREVCDVICDIKQS